MGEGECIYFELWFYFFRLQVASWDSDFPLKTARKSRREESQL